MGDVASRSLSCLFFFTSPSCRRRQGTPHPMRFLSSFQSDLRHQLFFLCYGHHCRLNAGVTKNHFHETPKLGVYTHPCLVNPRLILRTPLPLLHQRCTRTLSWSPRQLAGSYVLDRDLILPVLATFSMRLSPLRRSHTPAGNPRDIFHGRAMHSFSSDVTLSRRRRFQQASSLITAISRVS